MHSTAPRDRFSSDNRLRDAKSYRAVLSSAHRGACGDLRWHARTKDAGPPRLGLSAPKRHLRTAVKRNRVKRLIRESFRSHQGSLAGKDVLVVVRRPIDDEGRLVADLDRVWQRIAVIS